MRYSNTNEIEIDTHNNSESVLILFRDYLKTIFEQIFILEKQVIAGYFQISEMDRCRKEPQRGRNYSL